MSAEVTSLDLDAQRLATVGRQHAAPRPTSLLEPHLRASSSDALRRPPPTDNRCPTTREARDPGPLGVDLVGELAERARNHGKRLRPVLAHWGWAVAGGTPRHPRRTSCASRRPSSCCTSSPSSRTTSWTGRPPAAAGPPCTSSPPSGTAVAGGLGDADALRRQRRHPRLRPGPERGDAARRPGDRAQVRAAWRLMAVELVEGQLLDVTHTAGRRRDLRDLAAHRPLQERPLHDHPAAAARRPRRRAPTPGSSAGSCTGATSSATRSPCATTSSACGATPPAPASPPATTCARASRPRCSPGPAELLPDRARPLLAACDAGTLDDAGVDALQQAMVDAGVRERAERRRRRPRRARPPRARRPRRRPRGRRRPARPRRRHRLAVRVRVVVIGAGLSGLAAACHLTAAGHDVTVLEREAIVGGRAGELRLGDFRIDTGPVVMTMPELLHAPIRAVGGDPEALVPMRRLDPAYRAVYPDGSELHIRADMADLREEIRTKVGDADAAGFDRFLVWLEQLYETEFATFVDHNYSSPLDLVRSPGDRGPAAAARRARGARARPSTGSSPTTG